MLTNPVESLMLSDACWRVLAHLRDRQPQASRYELVDGAWTFQEPHPWARVGGTDRLSDVLESLDADADAETALVYLDDLGLIHFRALTLDGTLSPLFSPSDPPESLPFVCTWAALFDHQPTDPGRDHTRVMWRKNHPDQVRAAEEANAAHPALPTSATSPAELVAVTLITKGREAIAYHLLATPSNGSNGRTAPPVEAPPKREESETSPDEQSATEPQDYNPKEYITLTEALRLWNHKGNYKAFNKVQAAHSIHTHSPSPHRRMVHLQDWLAFLRTEQEAKFECLNQPAAIVDELAAIHARKEQIRALK